MKEEGLFMTSLLKEHFPMIRDRKTIIHEIGASRALQSIFHSWTADQQEEFLDFCTGARGIKILYDVFIKEVLNPEMVPEHVSSLLSVILKREVRIVSPLPHEGSQITAGGSLIVTDILVVFEDGSYGNVEIQKIGYLFPGERAACYSADLLLRQYKRVRSRQKKFSYKNMKPVYTIVIYENSPKEFHAFPDTFIHTITPVSDTGIKLNLLQNYTFVALDIFTKNHQNKVINSKLDAWMVFLSSDRPEDIVELITAYPEFKPLYEMLYDFCLNTEKVMEMFSKELRMMDDNTVAYMIDIMQEEIDNQKKEIDSKRQEIDNKNHELDNKNQEIDSKNQEIDSLKDEIESLKRQLKKTEA